MEQTPVGEKLQKILARRGLGSRRALEKLIQDGRVTVNGKMASLGDRAQEQDRIELDGKAVATDSLPVRVILYNKPEGQVSTRKDEKGRNTIFSNLPRLSNQRWINVGRLDINTTGLILFTTDGELANRLMHPSSEIDREYLIRVFGEVREEHISAMLKGVELDDGVAKFTDVVESDNEKGLNKWFTVCLMEGRHREVRRLWESQGIQVNRLKRVRYGPVFLPSFVRPGQWVDLGEEDIRQLYKRAELPVPRIAIKLPNDRDRAKRQEKKLRARGNN